MGKSGSSVVLSYRASHLFSECFHCSVGTWISRRPWGTRPCTTVVCTVNQSVWSCCSGASPLWTSVSMAKCLFTATARGFTGGAAVKTPCFQCRGWSFHPWLGIKIPHAMQCSQKIKYIFFKKGERITTVRAFSLLQLRHAHSVVLWVLFFAFSRCILDNHANVFPLFQLIRLERPPWT